MCFWASVIETKQELSLHLCSTLEPLPVSWVDYGRRESWWFPSARERAGRLWSPAGNSFSIESNQPAHLNWRTFCPLLLRDKDEPDVRNWINEISPPFLPPTLRPEENKRRRCTPWSRLEISWNLINRQLHLDANRIRTIFSSLSLGCATKMDVL